MKLNWQKWGLAFWSSLARHVGTAGTTFIALGVKDGKIEWHNLWVAIVAGGVMPAVFTFLQSTPAPDDEDGAAAVKPIELPKGP